MFSKPIFFTALISLSLSACGTTTVSPEISGKKGVYTSKGPEGYPVIEAIEFPGEATDVKGGFETCVRMNVDMPESDIISGDDFVQISGKSSFYFPETVRNQPFRYTMVYSSRENKYRFERLRYLGESGPTSQVMASKHWSPENVYSSVEKIWSSIEECFSRT